MSYARYMQLLRVDVVIYSPPPRDHVDVTITNSTLPLRRPMLISFHFEATSTDPG